ncbi:MAG: hypothetical protein P8R42_13880 [Candidatus Binatia bacterium]|nr:hypothetical protein [Candidatus Binatia bacterium]
MTTVSTTARSLRGLLVVFLGVGVLAQGCGSDGTTGTTPAPEASAIPALPEPPPAPTPEPEASQAALTHDFGDVTLGPGEELPNGCVQWTLNNEKPLYVNKVTLGNGGSYHHSNWFVVPEESYAGPDGRFDCGEREFNETIASVVGTVLFAQSTQSLLEEQPFAPGVVVKIPPRHKIIATVHLLNPSIREHETFLRVGLDLIHPRDVEVILTAFRLNYGALDIPPQSEARFTAECDFQDIFDAIIQQPIDLKLHWVLPHYHYLGNYFSVELLGGPNDGQVIHSLDTFNAEPNGKALAPPIDFAAAGARGLRMTCGYRNPRDESVRFGVGDQEMCVMLGLAESSMLLDGAVNTGNEVDGVVDGIVMNSGPCTGLGAPRNPAQTLPGDDEIEAPLYIPTSLPGDIDLPVIPPCADTPLGLSEPPATLSSISEIVFIGSCSFSACHDNQAPAGGLDLSSPNVYANLLGHEVTTAETSLPLIAPGDADGSWLYRLLSRCEPTDDTGRVVAHMPRNSPNLLPPEVVAKVRDWISNGALDN